MCYGMARRSKCSPTILTMLFRHTDLGGTVTLSVDSTETWVTAKVSDTGPGIEPECYPMFGNVSTKPINPGKGPARNRFRLAIARP